MLPAVTLATAHVTILYCEGLFYRRQLFTGSHNDPHTQKCIYSCSCFYQLLLRCTLFALYCTLFALGLIFSGGSGTVCIQTDPYCTLPTICQDNLFPSRHKISSAKKENFLTTNAEASFTDNSSINSTVTAEPYPIRCQLYDKNHLRWM